MRHVLAYFARDLADRPSKVVAALRGLSLEALLFMMAKTAREDTRRAMSEYITSLRHVKPALTGKDLISMGYKPGPAVGLVLRALRDAKVDGLVKTADDERRMVRQLFSSNSGRAVPVTE
jgi:tRNA nucleotidyltransferase (CCA-adding enzyme)